MVSASCTRLLFLQFCWSLTMASDNFNEIKIQQLGGNVLRISCDVINGASDRLPIQMSIFADTPDNTLVSVLYEKCPKVQDSAKDKHIYLPECVPNGQKMSLDIFLANYNPIENQQFGCDYEYVYLVGKSQILNSVSLATVSSSGTPSSADRDDTSTDEHAGTLGSHDGNFLRISCGAINAASDSNPIQLSIYEDTPNNTLVSIVYRQCPKVQDAGKDKHIHLTECVQNGENMFTDTVLSNFNPAGSKHFGCNYMYVVGEGQTSNSVPLATVSSPGNPPSTVRDGTSTDDHAGTWGRHDTLLVVLVVLAVLNCLLLLLIILDKYKMCWKINCRRGSSSGKTPQAESKMLEYSKQDEQGDINPCPINNNTQKSDSQEKLMRERLRKRFQTANSSPDNVTGEEEYQVDNPGPQVRKLPMPETCVDISLMD